MRHKIKIFLNRRIVLVFLLCLPAACDLLQNSNATRSLSVFAGSAAQPVLKEIALAYRQQNGVNVDLVFGSSGVVLSRMQLTGMGDVYIPGSMGFMNKAQKQNLIAPDSIRPVAYLVPAINVKPGNPKNILSLADLRRPGLRLGIARPEHVCLGLYAVELLDANGLLAAVLPNIVVTTESCAKTASAIALADIDAVIGWREFQYWDPRRIESVLIKDGETIPRVAVIAAAVTASANDPTLARDFVDFLCTRQAGDIFRKWGYITEESEVRRLAPYAEIGGEYSLPEDWERRKPL